MKYRWTNIVSGFEIPLKVAVNGTEVILNPKAEWSDYANASKIEKVEVNKDFYVLSKNVAK